MFVLSIPDMTCSGRVTSVTRAVRTLDASADVEADLVSHHVSISTTAKVQAVMTVLQSAGYTPDVLSSPQAGAQHSADR
jgi:copper chaperone